MCTCVCACACACMWGGGFGVQLIQITMQCLFLRFCVYIFALVKPLSERYHTLG